MGVKCSVFIATSVDGFIAGIDGAIEWLQRPEYEAPEDQGLTYDQFISTVDAIVMGRNTFAKVLSFGYWPYEGTPVVVLSRSELEVPDFLHGKVTVTGGAPQEIVERLAGEGKNHLYIDGGITIQQFLQTSLIHEMTITQLPILLGAGIPLFGTIDREVPLKLLALTVFTNGLVQFRYQCLEGR